MRSHCGNADGMMVRGSEGWRREEARDGGGEENREDKMLLSCRQTESPGVHWEWGGKEGGLS